MANPARFWNFIANRYAKRPIADQATYEKKLEITRRYLTPEAKVLEFGCGTGSTALLHAPYVGELLAIDFSERMIDIANGKLADQALNNLTFRQASIETLDQPDESFDAILGLSVLHLLDDRDSVIKRVTRLLRPDGCFISNTACLEDSINRMRYLLPIGSALGLLPRVRFFSTGNLLTAFENAGLVIEQQWQPAPGKALFVVARKPGAKPNAAGNDV